MFKKRANKPSRIQQTMQPREEKNEKRRKNNGKKIKLFIMTIIMIIPRKKNNNEEKRKKLLKIYNSREIKTRVVFFGLHLMLGKFMLKPFLGSKMTIKNLTMDRKVIKNNKTRLVMEKSLFLA